MRVIRKNTFTAPPGALLSLAIEGLQPAHNQYCMTGDPVENGFIEQIKGNYFETTNEDYNTEPLATRNKDLVAERS
jgi:hypothetical protein